MNWLQKYRLRRNRAIARTVVDELHNANRWRKFLPPVAVRDELYLMTEDGQLFRVINRNGQPVVERLLKLDTTP